MFSQIGGGSDAVTLSQADQAWRICKVNLNKKSMSLSVGVPGFHFNFGPQGPQLNVDLPGGLSYRTYLGHSKKDEKADKAEKPADTPEKEPASKQHAAPEPAKERAKAIKAEPIIAPVPPQAHSRAPQAEPPPEPVPPEAQANAKDAEPEPKRSTPRPKRVQAPPAAAKPVMDVPVSAPAQAAPPVPPVPADEEPFRLGFIAYQRGDFVLAYRHFVELFETPYQADALFMAGITACYIERDEEAIDYLGALLDQGRDPLPGDPESLVAHYLPDETINIQITDTTAVDLPLDTLSALLLVVELLQAGGETDEAVALLEDVFVQNPSLRLAQLSLADLYVAQGRWDALYSLFAQHTPELTAEDDAAVEILYYWAQALTMQGTFDAADKV